MFLGRVPLFPRLVYQGLKTGLVKFPPLPPPRFGVRFPSMSDAYDRELLQLAQGVGAELGFADFLREGVYCVLGGPSFETIAECRMMNRLGADAVGESWSSYPKLSQHLSTTTIIFYSSNNLNF